MGDNSKLMQSHICNDLINIYNQMILWPNYNSFKDSFSKNPKLHTSYCSFIHHFCTESQYTLHSYSKWCRSRPTATTNPAFSIHLFPQVISLSYLKVSKWSSSRSLSVSICLLTPCHCLQYINRAYLDNLEDFSISLVYSLSSIHLIISPLKWHKLLVQYVPSHFRHS